MNYKKIMQYKFQGVFTIDDTISVNILPGMKIDLNQYLCRKI